jgi:hypothetical protein
VLFVQGVPKQKSKDSFKEKGRFLNITIQLKAYSMSLVLNLTTVTQ